MDIIVYFNVLLCYYTFVFTGFYGKHIVKEFTRKIIKENSPEYCSSSDEDITTDDYLTTDTYSESETDLNDENELLSESESTESELSIDNELEYSIPDFLKELTTLDINEKYTLDTLCNVVIDYISVNELGTPTCFKPDKKLADFMEYIGDDIGDVVETYTEESLVNKIRNVITDENKRIQYDNLKISLKNMYKIENDIQVRKDIRQLYIKLFKPTGIEVLTKSERVIVSPDDFNFVIADD